MNFSAKKATKKTTSTQFEVLVKQLEPNPNLARGAPTFGADRVTVDELWQRIAVKVNSYGPPQRSSAEWKKIWFDLKSRTKKKIAENNNSLQATGGGPYQCSPLSEMEQSIERMQQMSKAAAPAGKIFGIRLAKNSTAHQNAPPTAQPTVQLIEPAPQLSTPPNAQPTAQPTAWSASQSSADSNADPTSQQQTLPQTDTTPTRRIELDILLTPTRQATQIGVVTPISLRTDTPAATPNNIRNNPRCLRRKRNFQEAIAESAREQAKAAKMQAEASKQIAAALQTQAEATKVISSNLAQLVEITARQTVAFEEFVKIMKNT